MLTRAQIATLASAFFSGVSTWLDYRQGWSCLAACMGAVTLMTLVAFAVMWWAKRETAKQLEALRKVRRETGFP